MSLFGPRVLLADSGSLTAQSYRAAVANRDTSNDKVLSPRDAAVGMFIMIGSLLSMANQGYGYPVFCNDRYPTRKLGIYAGYKSKRFERYTKVYTDPAVGNLEVPEGEELSLHQQFRAVIQPFIKSLPFIQCYSPGEEADDSLATASVQIGRVTNTKITISTRDTDMFQLIGKPRIQLLYKQPNVPAVIMADVGALQKYPVQRCDQIPLYKAFMGDDGDSVPKMAKVWEKFVCRDIIGNRSTVQEIYDAWWAGDISQDGWHRGWEDYVTEWVGEDTEQRGQAFINERLTRLKEDCNMVYEYTGGDYVQFLDRYNQMASMVHGMNLPEPLQLWNTVSGWATKLFPVFEKDQIPLSNPGLEALI